MLTLYETSNNKILYDTDKLRTIGMYSKYYLGWIWTEDLIKMEKEYDKTEFEYVLSTAQHSKLSLLDPYTTINYETWEDFILDQL